MKSLIFVTLPLLNALHAYAVVTCNSEHPADLHLPGEDILKTIRPILDGPGLALCNDIPYTNASDVLYYESKHYTFQIDRQQHTDTIENCKAAFESLIVQCIVGEQALGGEVYTNNVMYENYHIVLRKRDIRIFEELEEELTYLLVRNADDDSNEQNEEELDYTHLESRTRGKERKPAQKPKPKPALKSPTKNPTIPSLPLSGAPTHHVNRLSIPF